MFGLKGDVSGNIAYLDDTTVVYPCGHNLVKYNTETRTQEFVPGTPGSLGFTAMATYTAGSGSKKQYTAFAEMGERPTITVYDWGKSVRKRHINNLGDVGSALFTSMSFSGDGKFLIVQGGPPEWLLIYLAWDKAKVVATVKSSNTAGSDIHQADCNPMDPTVVCVSGDHVLKLFRVADNTFKPLPMNLKRDPQTYLCHSWLTDDRMVVCTDSGEILLFEGNEFRTVLITSPSDGNSIDSVTAFSKGFICGCDDSVLRVYERSEDRDYYKNTKRFKVQGTGTKVTAISVSETEDNLACTLATHQAYQLALANAEMLKVEEMTFDPLVSEFHAPGAGGLATVTGLATCIRKPIVVTTGLDRTVRVWNTQTFTCDLIKSFPEEAHSVALHPSGLHVLVGFSDKLRLMNILMDDVRAFKEFPIKACRECRFSNGGHLFAAVNGTAVFLYATYTCEAITSLRGHNGKVRALAWSADDRYLLSVGADGAIFRWDVRDGKPQSTTTISDTSLSCVATVDDAATCYVVGEGANHARHPFVHSDLLAPSGSRPKAEVNLGGSQLSVVLAAPSGNMLFTGSAEPGHPGVIRSYKLPLTDDPEYQEVLVHAGPVTRMVLSFDESMLFTTSDDGTLSVFETKTMAARGTGKKGAAGGAGGATSKRDKDSGPIMMPEEILVTKSDIEEKAALMSELRSKVEELTLHNNYQLRLKDLNYKEKIKQVEDKFQQELAADKSRYLALKEEKQDMEMDYDDKIAKLEAKHVAELEELEATYKAKITAEVERYESLVKEREAMNERWDETNATMVETHEKRVADLRAEYAVKLEEEERLKAQLTQEKHALEVEIDEATVALEEDADLEIEEVKAKYDARLTVEKKATLMLKGENGIMKKKFAALTSKIAATREEIKGSQEKEKEVYELIKGLEKDIQGHKKEIREREETIGDKERRIYDLRKKNQELEKFKFVLNYKIQELKRQIMPRKKEITDMREQIKEMELELLQYHKSNAALDLMIGELRLKKEGMQRECDTLDKQLVDGDAVVRRFRSDLHDAVQHISDYKKLKACIGTLYRQYVHEGVASGGAGEADLQKEYSRQREYLEKSVESLKRKLAKDMEMHRNDHSRLSRENTQLTSEVNMLRRELRFGKQSAVAAKMGYSLNPDGTVVEMNAPRAGRRSKSRGSQRSTGRLTPGGATGTLGAPALRTTAVGIDIRTTARPGAGGTAGMGGTAPAALLGEVDPTQFTDEEVRELEMQRMQIEQLTQHLDRLRSVVPTAVAEGMERRPESRGDLPALDSEAPDAAATGGDEAEEKAAASEAVAAQEPPTAEA